MRRVVSRFVPRLLTQDQRDSGVAICQENLDRASEDENSLKRIITGYDIRVYGYDVGKNAVFTIGWKKFTETEKARGVKCNVKVMLTVFFTSGCCAS
jgi:hypothetical protein